ncbi:MAG: hypothetical protein ACQESR_16060 [Planctomycetota bacterium]
MSVKLCRRIPCPVALPFAAGLSWRSHLGHSWGGSRVEDGFRLARRRNQPTFRLGFVFQAVGLFRMERGPAQAVLPLVGLAAENVIRDPYMPS